MSNYRKLDTILSHNEEFVKNEEYKQYETSGKPDKKIAILACMDARLIELLPKAMNIQNGDAKIIKNAGALITDPYGSIMRSIMVCLYEFDIDEILVVGHYKCGMCNLDPNYLIGKILEKGIPQSKIEEVKESGIDIKNWLSGFESLDKSIQDNVNVIKNHPLIPKDLIVHGLAMDPQTGKIDVVVDGYEEISKNHTEEFALI